MGGDMCTDEEEGRGCRCECWVLGAGCWVLAQVWRVDRVVDDLENCM